MTHTLHRHGAAEDLQDDYTVICMAAAGYNVAGSGPGLKRFLTVALEHDAINFGDIMTGSPFNAEPQDIINSIKDGSIVHAVFAAKEKLVAFLRAIKDEDLGLSVVVQGVCSQVEDALSQIGQQPHTINTSLGIWGRSERLADHNTLRITTMCGHALVSKNLVAHLVKGIRAGRIGVKSAAEELAAQCVCGVFNPNRAERILREMVESK